MAIPPVTKDGLEAAMQRFDREERETSEWHGWEEKQNYKFAIETENGVRYPVKKIVSMASGVPTSTFSGGRGAGQANQVVRAHHYDVVELRKKNPPWVRDELILALELYLQHPASPPNAASQAVQDLSAVLNRLGSQIFSDRTASHRNPNGVYMKLMNYRRLDPRFPEAKGLDHGGKAEEEIWKEFASDPVRCSEAAQLIRASLEELEQADTDTEEIMGR